MNSDAPSSRDSRRRSWLDRLTQALGSEPQNRAELIELLQSARKRAILDTDALTMIEGVLGVADLRVRDIMIPRAEMDVIERDASLEEILPAITRAAHSRYPVIGDDRAEVLGILLAKDLLQYCGQNAKGFNMRDVLRPAVFVPESKRLNVLLNEFRTNRNHMAIVVDEYGAAAGLVTIEDVLEQIVGEIEDEYDFDEDTMILQRSETRVQRQGADRHRGLQRALRQPPRRRGLRHHRRAGHQRPRSHAQARRDRRDRPLRIPRGARRQPQDPSAQHPPAVAEPPIEAHSAGA